MKTFKVVQTTEKELFLPEIDYMNTGDLRDVGEGCDIFEIVEEGCGDIECENCLLEKSNLKHLIDFINSK
jgi:hypothetical protein